MKTLDEVIKAMGNTEWTAKVENITEYYGEKYGNCPCGKGVHDKYNYCPLCGARLDWSVDE